MKVVLVIAVLALIYWSYASTVKDIYLSYKRRKLNSQMKRMEVEARSDDVRAIRRIARKKKLEPFAELINSASPGTIQELVSTDFKSPLVEKMVQQGDSNAKVHFLYGHFLLTKAWEARSGAVASDVSNKQAEGFYDFLSQAEQQLTKSRELDRAFIGVYSGLLNVAMGQSDKEQAYQVYNDAFQIAPEQLDYHLSMLVILTEKWLGSEDEMFEFARKHAGRVSTGPLKGLIPAAHFEAQLFMESNETEAYFAQPEVQNEIREAYAGIANVTVGSSFNKRHQYYLALNFFAIIFQYMNDHSAAREVYEKIGGNRTTSPWKNIGKDTRQAFMEYKSLAFQGK